jgi:hypothetical protein
MFGLGVVLAPWLFAASASADETYGVTSIITVPGNPLQSTDIAWVDPVAGVYLLADRSNAAVDVINTRTNKFTKHLLGGFAGTPGTGHGAGPNGVLLANSTYVWAGDGNSLVKVINLYSGALLATINTGGGMRADELCFDPVDNIILIGNPSETTASQRFITFIDAATYQILGKIVMDGTHGKPLASGGIEQCQYSPRTGTFYINVPGANGTDGTVGTPTPPVAGHHALVLQIDPVSEKILNTVDVYDPTACTANNGMAIGPFDAFLNAGQIGLGCTATTGKGSVIISENFGPPGTNQAGLNVRATLPNTFTDEMWFNPGDNHYFFGNSSFSPGGVNTPQLGVVDALGEDGASAPKEDQPYPASAIGSSTVAVEPAGNKAYVVIKNTAATATPPSTICSSYGGTDSQGCIAVFTVTSGTDDPGSCFQQGGSFANCPGVPPE